MAGPQELLREAEEPGEGLQGKLESRAGEVEWTNPQRASRGHMDGAKKAQLNHKPDLFPGCPVPAQTEPEKPSLASARSMKWIQERMEPVKEGLREFYVGPTFSLRTVTTPGPDRTESTFLTSQTEATR